ncbi:UNVERIFIED_CONTAM: hypothetical protein Sindi_0751100, partial [Sesamum indicum]
IKSIDYLMQGFDRCTLQVQKLKGFVEGFDINWLDPTLDSNLSAFPEEELPNYKDDKFGALVEEIENMDEDEAYE